MIKLAVGCPSVDALAYWMQQERHNGQGVIHTRTMPKRAAEILDGGSLYRVLNGMVLCRQPITGLEPCRRTDGTNGTLILVSDEIIPVLPRPMRAFQGWRYLDPSEAPPDLAGGAAEGGALPPELRQELTELALI